MQCTNPASTQIRSTEIGKEAPMNSRTSLGHLPYRRSPSCTTAQTGICLRESQQSSPQRKALAGSSDGFQPGSRHRGSSAMWISRDSSSNQKQVAGVTNGRDPVLKVLTGSSIVFLRALDFQLRGYLSFAPILVYAQWGARTCLMPIEALSNAPG